MKSDYTTLMQDQSDCNIRLILYSETLYKLNAGSA